MGVVIIWAETFQKSFIFPNSSLGYSNGQPQLECQSLSYGWGTDITVLYYINKA